MLVKSIIDEDFVNYKKASMYIGFPYCTFKCEKECGIKCCQNSPLAISPNIDISIDSVVKRYIENPISHAIVLAGLEPLDSFNDIVELVTKFRNITDDDIVIYTGYNESEIQDKIEWLSKYKNIIIKYGRFIPNDTPRFDPILGITLASKNQYAAKL